uniref:Uncharacterized protein n=1 Tax=Oncorhynchus mykiss TaxID=8022 RepID=A0A8C7QWY1_ONCMY
LLEPNRQTVRGLLLRWSPIPPAPNSSIIVLWRGPRGGPLPKNDRLADSSNSQLILRGGLGEEGDSLALGGWTCVQMVWVGLPRWAWFCPRTWPVLAVSHVPLDGRAASDPQG